MACGLEIPLAIATLALLRHPQRAALILLSLFL